jgi:hypothetical protein
MISLRDLYSHIREDSAREQLGWSPDLETAQADLLAAKDDSDRARILNEWLASRQPCLFGKIAAKNGMIEFCFLTEGDLAEEDGSLEAKIRAAHERWWDSALQGQKSGFVVLCISPRLALARPDHNLLEFGRRLAQLYLHRDEIAPDQIYLDQAFLEVPARPTTRLFRWDAGVNVFAAAADRRWWQDHRIPAGFGFSVNSVGHMVKSAELTNALIDYHKLLDLNSDQDAPNAVDSLGKALVLAMSTIANASNAVSGKATWLVPEAEGFDDCEPCPVELGKRLDGMTHCYYRGYYHTDITLPSEYFRDDVRRPEDLPSIRLDLSYLFRDSVHNPAYQTMGVGQRIRSDDDDVRLNATERRKKSHRNWPTVIDVSSAPAEISALLARRANR